MATSTAQPWHAADALRVQADRQNQACSALVRVMPGRFG